MKNHKNHLQYKNKNRNNLYKYLKSNNKLKINQSKKFTKNNNKYHNKQFKIIVINNHKNNKYNKNPLLIQLL